MRDKKKRAERKRQLMVEDMKSLADSLQNPSVSIEKSLARMAEALIVLLEAK